MTTSTFPSKLFAHRASWPRLGNKKKEFETDFAPLLDLWADRAHSEGAVIYRYDADAKAYSLSAANSMTEAARENTSLAFTDAEDQWLLGLRDPLQVRSTQWKSLPEPFENTMTYLLVLPLRRGNQILGLAVLGRTTGEFPEESIDVARRIGRIACALLERKLPEHTPGIALGSAA